MSFEDLLDITVRSLKPSRMTSQSLRGLRRFVVLTMAVGAAACGGSPTPTETPAPDQTEPDPEPAVAPTPEPEPEPDVEAGRVVWSPAVLVGGNMPDKVRDALTRDVIRVIKDAEPLFRKCYGRAAARGSAPRGDVNVIMLIEPGGTLDRITSGKGTTLTDTTLVNCALGVFQQLQLPSPPSDLSIDGKLQFYPE